MAMLLTILIGCILLLILVAIIATIFVVITYNNIIKTKNKVKNSWANIDAQLQRRFDLIPNLVETVKGFMSHEKQLMDNMSSTRDGYMHAHSNEEKLAINAQLSSNLKLLYSMTETYPQLKRDTNFLKLQNELAEIEEDITYARQFYNDAVTIYNNKIMTFPSNMIASMFGLKEEQLFDAVKEAESAPSVKLQTTKYRNCPNCGATVSNDSINCAHCGCSLL